MKTFLLFSGLILLASCAPPVPDITTKELEGRPSQVKSVFESDSFQGGREQARGFYSGGSLVSADLLPPDGNGFVKIHRPRNRGYGTFDLVQILQHAAAEMQRLYPSTDRIMIGDMSDADGGFLSGHGSHQNGLDADIAFLRLNRTEQRPEYILGFEESFVENGKLTENFDRERNWALAKVLIATGRVQRLFVGEVIKKGICEWARQKGELESEQETLRRLRVISGHTEHFHVRVDCPKNSPRCQAQEEIPSGPVCP